MLSSQQKLALRLYVAAVVIGGAACILAALIERPDQGDLVHAQVAVLTVAVLVAELLPIKVYARGTEGEATISSTFAMALLIADGHALAIVCVLTARVVAEIILGKSFYKLVFNIAQTAISLTLAALAIGLLADLPRVGSNSFLPSDMPAIVVGLCVFFICNSLLVGTVLALAEGVAPRDYLTRGWWSGVATNGLLLALAPIVVIVTAFYPPLIALIALPLYAIHRGGSVAVAREHDSLHDPLTGLPNRVLFFDRVEQALHASRRSGIDCVVMALDLDGFKEVNDTYGHQTGDLVLKEVAIRLSEALRSGDTVARLGGDEFAVLLHAGSDSAAAEVVAGHLRDSLARPLSVGGKQLKIGGSVGVSRGPAQGENVGSLLAAADQAMYEAKAAGTGYATFRPEPEAAVPTPLAR